MVFLVLVSLSLLLEASSFQKICGLLSTQDENIAFELAMLRLRGAYPASNFSSLTKPLGNEFDTVMNFQDFARSGCQIIIGPRSSGLCTAVKAISKRTQIPYISNAATNDNVLWHNPYFFRLHSGDIAQGEALVETVNTFGWTQVVVVGGPSTFARTAAKDFIFSCLSRGITVLDFIIASNPQQFNVSSTLLATGRIFVLFANSDVAAVIFTRAHSIGLLSSPYFWLSNSDAWKDPKVAAPVLKAMQVHRSCYVFLNSVKFLITLQSTPSARASLACVSVSRAP